EAYAARAVRIRAHRTRSQRVRSEVRQVRGGFRSAPRKAPPLTDFRVPRTRLFPLEFGGQPRARPRRVGLGLEVGDVLDGLVGGNVLLMAEPRAGAVRIPELR